MEFASPQYSDNSELTSPQPLRTLIPVHQGQRKICHIELNSDHRLNSFEQRSFLESENKGMNMQLDSARATADFNTPFEIDSPFKQLEQEPQTENAGIDSFVKGSKRSSGRYNEEFNNVPYDIEKKSSIEDFNADECVFESVKLDRNGEIENKSSQRNELITRPDSEIDQSSNGNYDSKRNKSPDLSRTEKDTYRYHQDFEFTENEF